eukprot:scaffold24865_cov56-Prasinocladus_malaysianus.AAC.1
MYPSAASSYYYYVSHCGITVKAQSKHSEQKTSAAFAAFNVQLAALLMYYLSQTVRQLHTCGHE